MTLIEVESRVTELEREVANLRQELERARGTASMKRSIEQIERGEGVPAVEAVKALGRNHGLTSR